MSCPFFLPSQRAHDIAFPHPVRLPLGASWRGTCSVAGHEQASLDQKELESCNLGYAKSCPRLPKERTCDAVRFSIASDFDEIITLQFVFESEYLPAGIGFLKFDAVLKDWASPHPEQMVQRKAECFLLAYLERRNHR